MAYAQRLTAGLRPKRRPGLPFGPPAYYQDVLLHRHATLTLRFSPGGTRTRTLPVTADLTPRAYSTNPPNTYRVRFNGFRGSVRTLRSDVGQRLVLQIWRSTGEGVFTGVSLVTNDRVATFDDTAVGYDEPARRRGVYIWSLSRYGLPVAMGVFYRRGFASDFEPKDYRALQLPSRSTHRVR